MYVILKTAQGQAIAVNPHLVASVKAHTTSSKPEGGTCHIFLAMMTGPIAEIRGTVQTVVEQLEGRKNDRYIEPDGSYSDKK